MSRQSLDSNNSLKGNELKNLHYEFTGETREVFGVTLHRIRATRDLPHFWVKSGAVGGWIEKESNLQGNAWVADEAMVYGDAEVFGYAKVYDNARVSGNSKVHGNARVYNNARLYVNAEVYGGAYVLQDALVTDNAKVYGRAEVSGNAKVYDSAEVSGNAKVFCCASVFGDAKVYGNAKVGGYAKVSNDARIKRSTHYFHAITCTSLPILLTLTRQKAGKHLIRMGCWEGTIDEFESLIAQPKWIETKEEDVLEARPEMEILASLMRARIERWK